ncbi:hypothetical protein E2C01_068333 [Portunus trituberculatus]|uniref:Uncharacterized protein n=1 Tax=Portunus trituberculatus TaxID=210409 RepID=A0A5B7HW67_PORTR|nr:hypothetical protein [Portunus trituberculatus]
MWNERTQLGLAQAPAVPPPANRRHATAVSVVALPSHNGATVWCLRVGAPEPPWPLCCGEVERPHTHNTWDVPTPNARHRYVRPVPLVTSLRRSWTRVPAVRDTLECTAPHWEGLM